MASKKSNPRNEESVLYKQLTRLFSGPIVNYRKQTQRNMRQRHMEKFGTKFYSVHGQTFKKERYDPFASLQTSIMVNHMRATRYGDFEQMEFDPIIASALDVYGDELTTSTHLDPLLRIKCPNDEIKDVLRVLYSDILNLEFNIYGWARSLCKHGDLFLYLDIDDKMGIKNTIAMPSLEIERLEGEDKTNPNYVQFQWNAGHMTFENWQMVHFRLLGNDKYCPYGTSVLDPARRVWRQLCVSHGSKVWIKGEGYKRIEEVKSGDTVLSFDYKENSLIETKVKKLSYMGKQKVCSVITRHRKIDVTPNHGLLVKTNNGEFVYKKAEDIEIKKDCLVLPEISDGIKDFDIELNSADYSVSLAAPLNEEMRKQVLEATRKMECEYSDGNISNFLCCKGKVPYQDYKKIRNRFNIDEYGIKIYPYGSKQESILKNFKFKITKDFVRFLGFMYGDGWLFRDVDVSFALGVDENKNKFYFNLMENLFQKRLCLQKKARTVSLYSKEIVNIMKKVGFISGFAKKTIPNWVFNLCSEYKREFVRGLFDADGCKKNKRICLSNKKLIEEVEILCQQCGIDSCAPYLRRKAEKCIIMGKESNRVDSYDIFCNVDKEYDEEKVRFEKVLRIEPKEIEDTYDLEIDHPLHNFVVEGIVSHNTLLEDAMMAYRIVRSPERRVFYIDVGNIDPNDVEQFMEKVKTNLKRNQIVDVETGRVDLRYNPTSIEEDYFIPVRGGTSSTKIETLPGGTYTGDIEDVQYLKDKLFAALKVPQSYLSRGEGADEDKTTLAQKDVRFARTIQRIQRSIISELEKIGIIHLYILGYRKEDLISFNLTMNNPSKIAELQELEHWRTKFDIASSATEGYFSKRWIAEKIFSLSQEEYLRLQREMFFDRDLSAKLDSIGTAEEGGGEGGLGGGLGGEGEELGAGEGEELGAGEEEAAPEEEEEGVLLAAPGKRDDKARLTPGAKGKIYFPVTSDKRDMGARKRSYHGLYGQESAGNSKRSLFKGYSELSGLSRGVAENIYDKEERKLLKENHELKLLLDSLEKKTKLNIIDKEDKKDEDK